MLKRLSFFMPILLLAATLPVHACEPVFRNLSGFYQAYQAGILALPANAKGAMFYVPVPHNRYSADGGTILRPEGHLSAANFSIRDVKSGQTLAASMKQIQLPLFATRGFERYFQFTQTRLNACFDAGKSESKVCRNIQQQFQQGGKAAWDKMVKAGLLREITNDVSKSYGMFRIEPAGGFAANKRYDFTYHPTSWRQPLIANPALAVEIAKTPLDLAQATAKLRLVAEGKVMMAPSVNTTCLISPTEKVQLFHTDLPAELVPYLRSLRLSQGERTTTSEFGFTASSLEEATGSYVQQDPGNSLPRILSRVAAACEHVVPGMPAAPLQNPPVAVEMTFAFLELDDKQFETPALPVSLGPLDARHCNDDLAPKS